MVNVVAKLLLTTTASRIDQRLRQLGDSLTFNGFCSHGSEIEYYAYHWSSGESSPER